MVKTRLFFVVTFGARKATMPGFDSFDGGLGCLESPVPHRESLWDRWERNGGGGAGFMVVALDGYWLARKKSGF
jgi:hypothetical protein